MKKVNGKKLYRKMVGVRKNPAPAGYHYMPDGRLMADSAHRNPVRTKTWKLGEYGGNIKAAVNDSRTAVQIIHSDKPLQAGAYGRLFRWPMDRFELEVRLNELTTSYYADKILDWISAATGVGRGLQNVTKYVSENPSGVPRMTAYEILIRHPRMRRFLSSYPMELPDSIHLDNAITEIERLMKTKKKITSRMIDSEVDSVITDAREQYGVNAERQIARGLTENPPLSSHGSNIKTKRTHGLSLSEMRALYRLVKQGNSEADKYARKKLEVPYSETKVQLLAVIDHHIRDLAGK